MDVCSVEPVDYVISEEMCQAISSDVEKLFKEMIDSNLIDEFTDGTCLDRFIHGRFDLIRNDIKKQRIKHRYLIDSIKSASGTEVRKMEQETKAVRQGMPD